MKYLKLLLIPVITLMFMVPSKALDEMPDWAYTEHYYVVSEYIPTGQLTVHILSTKNNYIVYGSGGGRGVYAPETYFIASYRLAPGSDTWVTSTGGTAGDINGVYHKMIYNINDNHRLKYSNFDIYVGGSLVFQETPVINFAMVQRKALEGLTAEVQGASGTILAVGGVILGAILVTHLVSRSRLWVKV